MKTQMEKLSSAAAWMAELANAEMSPAQRSELADWLRESPANVRALIEHTFIERDLAKLPISLAQMEHWMAEARSTARSTIAFQAVDKSAPDSVGGSDNSDDRGATVPLLASRHRVNRKWKRLRAMSLAASICAALISGSVLLYSHLGTYATGFAEQRTLTLADGSVVILNTESKIKVDFSENRRRIALLQGEAFFRVARDSTRPFLVNAAGAVVRAVGTQFDVKLAPQDTLVTVVEGRVNVSASGAPVTALDKGQEVRIRRHLANADPTPAIMMEAKSSSQQAAAWTQGRLDFDATPLCDVIAEFQRYRDFEVRFDDPSVRDLKLTASFDSHDSDSALQYIATLPGITVDKIGQHTYLIRRR